MKELIPGTWYDFRGHIFTNSKGAQVAAKFREQRGNTFYFDEAIRTKEGHFYYKGDWNIGNNELKELSVEELNKWLPEHLKIQLTYEIY